MTQKETLAAELHRLRQAQSELTDLIERAAASREGGVGHALIVNFLPIIRPKEMP